MINVICVNQGPLYSSEYPNRLYSMVKRNMRTPFKFYCYTDNPNMLHEDIIVVPIETDHQKWWAKLDLLNIFDQGENIFFDLDVIILNPLDILCSVKTRNLTVLYSCWKEVFPRTTKKHDRYPTIYNSSIMKWSGDQGKHIYDYFIQNKEEILFKYAGIDRYFFHENVKVDLLPTSIAYSYWKGANFIKDSEPEKLRTDYEVCIFNNGNKQHLLYNWTRDYWC